MTTGETFDSRTLRGNPLVRWLVVPGALCLLSALCFAVDMPIARFFEAKHLPKFVREVFDIAETFGHAAGVALILIAVYFVDPARRSWIPTCLAGAYGGGLTADLLKILITRMRPRNVELSVSTVWETFGPFLPFSKITDGDSHSFPSGHTAMAFGFAVVLSAMYPHARRAFFFFAILTGIHRMECLAHYPSDVCAGAAVGWLIGHASLALRKRIRGGREPAVADGGLPGSSNV